jgi:hypothetical protein
MISSWSLYRDTNSLFNLCGSQYTFKDSCSEAGYPETDQMDVVLVLPWPSGPSAPRAALNSSTMLVPVGVHVVAVVIVGGVVVLVGVVMQVVVVMAAVVVVVVVVLAS